MILSNLFLVLILVAIAIYFQSWTSLVFIAITLIISFAMVIADVEGKKYLNKTK